MRDEQQLESFRSLDWEAIAAKTLASALVLAARYGWGKESVLPNGHSVEDLVIEAITEIWDEPDRRNPYCELSAQFAGIVKHKLWNLAKSRDGRALRSDVVERAPAREGSGTNRFEVRDEFDRAMQLLLTHPKVRKQPELELVLAALGCGAFEVAEIGAETGLSRERIYQLTRELRSIYPSIARQLAGDGKAL